MNLKKFRLVTKFTMIQQVKGKSFKVSTIIILIAVMILSSLINIVPAIMGKDKDNKVDGGASTEAEALSINEIYAINESDMNIDLSEVISKVCPYVTIKAGEKSREDYIKELETTEERAILLEITKGENQYNVNAVTPKKAQVSLGDVDVVLGMVSTYIKTQILVESGVSPNDIVKAQTPVLTSQIEAGETEDDITGMITNLLFPMISCILLFYIIYFYGFWVANSIVSEKTSRVMELLLTSTKPIELVVGKCVGMGTLAIMQFVTIIISAFLGCWIGGLIGINIIDSSYNAFSMADIFKGIPVGKLIIVVIFFVLGYVLYAILNALVGATVSKLEDLNISLMPVTFISLIAFYVSYMALMSNFDLLSKIATYLPFSAPFYIPATILTDTVSYGQMGISLLIMVVSIILITLFTARVYSVVILQTGNRIKIKDLFNIYKNEK